MREVGALEATKTLSVLLDAVEHGEEIVITRRGKPVAKLVRHDTGSNPETAVAAVGRIKELRKGVTLGAGLTVKDLIDEGRR